METHTTRYCGRSNAGNDGGTQGNWPRRWLSGGHLSALYISAWGRR